MTRAAKAFV